jgi:hypothetical protein
LKNFTSSKVSKCLDLPPFRSGYVIVVTFMKCVRKNLASKAAPLFTQDFTQIYAALQHVHFTYTALNA